MNKTTILRYAIGLLLPAIVMYGTGYNGTVDALILISVWTLLFMSILFNLLIVIARIVLSAIDLNGEIPDDVKMHMTKAKVNLRRWWITIIMVGWMLVALSSVGWIATAVTYFISVIIGQINTRLFVGAYESLAAKITTKAEN